MFPRNHAKICQEIQEMPDNKQNNYHQSVKSYNLQYNQGLLKFRVMKTRLKEITQNYSDAFAPIFQNQPLQTQVSALPK